MKKCKMLCCMALLTMISGTISGCNEQDLPKEKVITIENKENKGITIKKEEVKRVVKQKETSKEFQQGMNCFSLHMFEELEDGENMFISPYSIAMALSMVDNGADKDTKKEIEEMLGITDLSKWNEDVNFYLTKQWNKKTFLENANSLWISNQMQLAPEAEKEYFSVVSKYFGAEKYYRDLYTTETKNNINQWVEKNTGGMIKEIVNENLSSETKMALLNAIYFEGKWDKKFLPENTEKQPFFGKEKETEVDTMCLEDESFSYIESNGLRAVELPYKNSSMVMDVILPVDREADVYSLFSKLSEKEQLDFFKQLSNAGLQEITTLCLPKFETEYSESAKIQTALQNLGMTSAFDEELADFGKISEQPLYISDIIHKAKIQVEENGTKASAVTGVFFRENACAIEEPEPILFIADHPFIYVIRDVEENIILFMGVMYDVE